MAKEQKIGMEHGKPLDLSGVLHKSPNRMYRIGIELEGGWTKLPPGCAGLQHDGSVAVERRAGDANLHLGELANGPMVMTEWAHWLKVNYPQRVNQTCGMHVHLSPRTSLCYSRLMDPTYPGTVVAYIKKWAEKEGLSKDHPLWPRLQGRSVYCQHLYMADDQVRNTNKDHDRNRAGHRYTVINYCHGRYGTVECRLLPMMENAAQGERAVQELVDITNAFLRATRRSEAKFKVETEVEDPRGGSDDLILEVPRNERRRREIR